MSFFEWFNPKNKRNVVLPTSDRKDLLHGLELVKAFTTTTEPQCADYPNGQYKVYWETVLNTVNGGYSALVRFYNFDDNAIVKEERVIKPDIVSLKDEVNKLIITTMSQNKR